MYPTYKKKALPQLDMQLVRHIVGSDPDYNKLLEVSIEKANKRVVMKRPKGSPILFKEKVVDLFISRHHNYFVYKK